VIRSLPSALTALAVTVALLAPAAAAAAPLGRTSLPAIERQVMCVTCKIPLNVAQSPQADRERAFIQSLIRRGYTEAQVKQALVAQYGPTVLGLPRAHGFDVSVYAVPVAVLAVVIALLLVLVPRWRRRAVPGSPDEGAPAGLDASQAARLESDLARFD